MSLIPGVDINTNAKVLADTEHELVKKFLNKENLSETFFAHGTEMITSGKEVAMRGRKEWDDLPFIEEGCDKLVDRIKAEERFDMQTKVKDLHVDGSGILRGGAHGGGLILDGVAWNQLASFGPKEMDSRVRTNLNTWMSGSKKEVRLRTRHPEVVTNMKQVYATVGRNYTAFDWDQLAQTIKTTQYPDDARANILYDGSRASFEVVLHNPYTIEEVGVGRLFRVAIVISSADNGTEGYRIKYKAVRIACINCTLIADENLIFRTTHRGNKVKEVVEKAIQMSASALDSFAAKWSSAYEKQYHDRYDGTTLSAEEVFKRLIASRKISVPHLEKDDLLKTLMDAWNREPGDTVAHVNNAITNMAHNATSSWKSPWYQEDLEEDAGNLLYAKNYVLDRIDDEKREEWGW